MTLRPLLAAALLGLAAPAFATTTTVGSLSVNGNLTPFGYPDTATYGQTTIVPTAMSQLESVTFSLDLPDTLGFRTYVYGWDGSKATNQIFASDTLYATGAGNNNFTLPVDVAVSAGQSLVLFISISEIYEANEGQGVGGWGYNNGQYAGGGMVFINNAGNEGDWTTQNWYTDYATDGYDMAFNAVYSDEANDVPEPAMLGLFGLGAIGLGLSRRRRAA